MAAEIFKGYVFELEGNKVPVAIILPPEQQAVVGSIVKLDARSSVDPEGVGLTYSWAFSQIPIGSQVNRFGFRHLEDDASITTFAPDVTGIYKVQLVVSDGSLTSEPAEASVDVRVILVPYHTGIIPDASFIWNYLSDFWKRVDGHQRFETFWSAAIQLVAAEMLKLYQYEYSKSIRDIQELFQRRWIAYESSLELDPTKTSFILADDQAGEKAETFVLDNTTGLPTVTQPAFAGLVTIPVTEGAFEKSAAGVTTKVGRILRVGDRSYTMGRASRVPRATNYAEDGDVDNATSLFTGSGFTVAMVGSTLRILEDVDLAGDYVITAVGSANQVTVTVAMPGGITSWPLSASSLKYSVIPKVGTYSGFFADREEIPAGLDKQYWRFSSTLVSDEHDFETQGVDVGDIIEVEVARTDVSLLCTIYAQVVSVDRNRLGFTVNLDDLVDGDAAGWLSPDAQVNLASELQVRGLLMGSDGNLVYTYDSAEISKTVSSQAFRRTYFEQDQTFQSVFELGPISVTVRPVQIIRNKNIPVHETLVSTPVLQEYIKQPVLAREGDRISIITDDGQVPLSREPYVLAENLDFIIDSDVDISGTCSLTAGSDEIVIPYGDLLDRSVREQDLITVTILAVDYAYSIRRVLGSDKLRVFPVPDRTLNSVPFSISRRVPGKFIRFVEGTFTKKKPAPERLWSEVSYYDNNDLVEANFGVLVGVTQDDLARADASIPYKSAVAGLMHSLVNGSEVASLELSAQILLGLPFTQNAGIIKEINPDFRKTDDGAPLYGRILVEVLDRQGKPTGLTNIYLYPHGRQIPDPQNPGEWLSALPDFSGIGYNPDTGKEFVVGDKVAQFVPLSKGVKVRDYLSAPEWIDQLVAQGNVGAQLDKYHSFQVLMNADLVTVDDINVVSNFVKRPRPHYTKITSALLKSVEDFVDIEDSLVFGRAMQFYELPSLGVPSAFKLDDGDANGSLINLNGVFYSRLLGGLDLETTQGSENVISIAEGFITARPALVEEHDVPFIRPGDLLRIIEGHNAGDYPIVDVVGEGELELDFTGVFQTLSEQEFVIYRPHQNPIWSGMVNVTTGDGQVATTEVVGTAGGIGAAGVAVGDLLVFVDQDSGTPSPSRVYTIVEVTPSLSTPFIQVIPDPVEATGQYTAWVIREGLLAKGTVAEFYAVPSPGFHADLVNGSPKITFIGDANDTDWLNVSLIRIGDTILHHDIPYSVVGVVPEERAVYVSPPALVGAPATEVDVILRPERSETVLSIDFLDRLPADSLDLELALPVSSGDGMVTNIGSPDVLSSGGTDLIDLGAVPGDFVHLYSGADSTIDIGYGQGIFPIVLVTGTSSLRLAYNMTQTNASPGVRYGIRRKRPHEG